MKNVSFLILSAKSTSDNKPELIKDVLAFANASYSAERYIIIGVVKDHAGVTITPVAAPEDSAAIQQYIHDNITPELIVSYAPYDYKGQNLMVLTIAGTGQQPYYPSKPIYRGGKPFLRENDLWIRKGSHKVLGKRDDLEKIYGRRQAQNSLTGKIGLTFKNGAYVLELNVVKGLRYPSAVNKARILQQLAERQALMDRSPRLYLEQYGDAHNNSSGSYEKMGLNALKQCLETVDLNFKDEDRHYLYEQRSYKLQLLVHNTGNEHLRDALVQLVFPELTEFKVGQHVYPNTYQQTVATGINYQIGYPKVLTENNKVYVSQDIGQVRHLVPVEIFGQPLRIVPLEELAGKEITVQASVHAANLTEPQRFELTIRLV